jgi:hypothetical protein
VILQTLRGGVGRGCLRDSVFIFRIFLYSVIYMIQNVKVFDVVLLNTNEQATVLEIFSDKNFLVEVYTDG